MVFLLEETKVYPKHKGNKQQEGGEKYDFVEVGHGEVEGIYDWGFTIYDLRFTIYECRMAKL
jgi:hypothetical protein